MNQKMGVLESSSETVHVVCFGATSAIAEAFLRQCDLPRTQFSLFARNQDRLAMVAQDLRVRGAQSVGVYDFNPRHPGYSAAVLANLEGVLDQVLVAWGDLPDAEKVHQDPVAAADAWHLNATAVIELLTALRPILEKQKAGTVGVITSVAGDRGRASNYLYGSAKGAVSTFLQGYRQALKPFGVTVVDLKPGFVRTPMTSHLDQSGLLWSEPTQIARIFHLGIRRGQAQVYAPWFWRWIMLVIRFLPDPIFQRLKL
jgi:decaprenylphospho-beta-D-erythro-pentofuranosid-2-ulose 2-reductase